MNLITPLLIVNGFTLNGFFEENPNEFKVCNNEDHGIPNMRCLKIYQCDIGQAKPFNIVMTYGWTARFDKSEMKKALRILINQLRVA